MKRLVLFMARHQVLWVLWLTAGIPFVVLSILLNIVTSTAQHLYAMWNWTWRDSFWQYAGSFKGTHRRSLRSLASRPAATGEWLHL